jgi:hypothetical protein
VTSHLSPDEIVASVEGDLPVARRQHVRECPTCAASIEHVRTTLEAVRESDDVPEPSPLFWEHLSARVHAATQTEQVRVVQRWWPSAWKPLLAGAFAASLIWAVGMRPQEDGGSSAVDEAAASTAVATWDDVVAGTTALSAEDVSGVAPLVADASTLVDELTPAELDVFARLLETEMGVIQ